MDSEAEKALRCSSAAALVFLSFACGTEDYDGALDGRRLKRSSFKTWEVRDLLEAGVRAEIPKDVSSLSDSDNGLHTSPCILLFGHSGARGTLSHC